MDLYSVLKKKGVALKNGLYAARLPLLMVAILIAIFFSTGSEVFAADATGKIKETGGKLLDTSRTIAMVVGGIGFGFSALAAGLLISVGGFNKQFKNKGIDIAKWSMVGFGLLVAIPLIVPMFIDMLNGLGGEQVTNPLGTGGK